MTYMKPSTNTCLFLLPRLKLLRRKNLPLRGRMWVYALASSNVTAGNPIYVTRENNFSRYTPTTAEQTPNAQTPQLSIEMGLLMPSLELAPHAAPARYNSDVQMEYVLLFRSSKSCNDIQIAAACRVNTKRGHQR